MSDKVEIVRERLASGLRIADVDIMKLIETIDSQHSKMVAMLREWHHRVAKLDAAIAKVDRLVDPDAIANNKHARSWLWR